MFCQAELNSHRRLAPKEYVRNHVNTTSRPHPISLNLEHFQVWVFWNVWKAWGSSNSSGISICISVCNLPLCLPLLRLCLCQLRFSLFFCNCFAFGFSYIHFYHLNTFNCWPLVWYETERCVVRVCRRDTTLDNLHVQAKVELQWWPLQELRARKLATQLSFPSMHAAPNYNDALYANAPMGPRYTT